MDSGTTTGSTSNGSRTKQRRLLSPPIQLPSTSTSTSTGSGGIAQLPPSPISRMEDRFSSASTQATRITMNQAHNNNFTARNDQSTSTEQNNSTNANLYYTPMLSSTEPPSRMAVLLSPARMISETLQSLAITTGRKLEEIWDEVGYCPDERSAEINDLMQKFRETCESKIATEQHCAVTYRQTIMEAKEEIQNIATALKIDVNPQLLNDGAPTQTLIDEHVSLEAILEGLRTTAATAKEDMQRCLKVLVESHDALGIPIDPKWYDIESDLTMRRREHFHEKIDEMREELSTRTAAVIHLVRDCHQLIHDLRMDVQMDGSDLDRRIAGSLVKNDVGTYEMTSRKRSETCVGINASALDELTCHLAKLHTEKRRRKGMLQEMGAEIAVLWEKLHIDEEEQMAFTTSVQGLSLETITKGENELKRLRTLKSEMIGNLISEARETITQMWELTNIKVEERRNFGPFYVRDDDSMNDELLEKHEAYILTLQTRMEQMKPILRLIERREVIVRERIQYEDLQKDPERLTQRGAALTKQLMAEERMAIRIKRDLPKLTEKLNETLNEWRDLHEEEFQFNGEVYTDVMARQEEEWKNYKADEAHRKLKKKQDEMHYVENRFAAQPQQQITKRRVGPSQQPFGDHSNATTSSSTATTAMETKASNNATAVPRSNHSCDTTTNTLLTTQQAQKLSLR